ncbi:MAG: cysteine--tRNA ligase [archaeon]|jgi:cysteinyl-tRNA synthetase
MVLKFFNSFGNKLEEFKSIKPGAVGLYTCGPTIYNYIHIGNLKCYTWEDLIKRYLIFSGYKVKQVMNYTDVDDKTIKGSIEKKMALSEYTSVYKKAFLEDVAALNILPAEIYCPATEHISEMVAIVQKLLDKGIAYRGEDGSIYYSIKKFPNYGKLAGIDPTQLKAGARIKQDEYEKEGIGDFALWKAWDENDGPVFWETSLGKGRPGWHIECSAMSMKYLGEHFDLHTGGIDNKFPHHENEIAQSEAASGKKFVNYWMHTAHLMVEGQKMSKSLGNFFTLRDLLNKGLKPKAIRYTFLNTNYRQQLNFTFESVKDAQKTLDGLQNLIERLKSIKETKANDSVKIFVDEALSAFTEAMDNDLNVPEAMKYVFDFAKKVNKQIDDGALGVNGAIEALDFLKKIDSVMGVLDFSEKFFEITEEQQKLVDERSIAKQTKDWKRADEIRGILKSKGIELVDNKDGSTIAKAVVK